MTEATRLTKLPGYDTAPDVYETPEVYNNSESTIAQSNSETTSESGDTGSDTAQSEEDGPFGGISRRRLFPERARSKFQAVGRRVDTRGLDLSDRVDGRRRGLQVKQRGTGDEDTDETLEVKIARLRREVEECRIQAEGADGKTTETIGSLGKVLADLETGGSANAAQIVNGQTDEQEKDVEVNEHTIGKISAFDARLTTLERALGLSSMDIDTNGMFTSPVLPSLDIMDQQIGALMTSASIAQLDATSSRIKRLAQEAEQLSILQSTPPKSGNGTDKEQETSTFSHDDMTKLNALYSLLPTLQRLSPTVPAILDRLRSLAVLHTGAANAAKDLDDVVKKQADTEAELKTWEESLTRLETVVKDALQANGQNGNVVRGWVDDLQKRIDALR